MNLNDMGINLFPEEQDGDETLKETERLCPSCFLVMPKVGTCCE